MTLPTIVLRPIPVRKFRARALIDPCLVIAPNARRRECPRAADADELSKLIEPYGKPTAAYHSLEEALPAALKLAGRQKGIIVTGSVFVAAGARVVWAEMHTREQKQQVRD